MNKLLNIALSQYGINEWPGDEHNPEVVKYFKSLGFNYNDETSWCSAFLNWCCINTHLQFSGKLDARSWLAVGEKVYEPQLGDIAVFWRDDPNSWKGHVGIYINKKDVYYNILGGNQDNMVCIKQYPTHRLLGFRRIV